MIDYMYQSNGKQVVQNYLKKEKQKGNEQVHYFDKKNVYHIALFGGYISNFLHV